MYITIVVILIVLFGLPIILDYRLNKRVSTAVIIVALVIVLILSWLLRPMINRHRPSQTRPSGSSEFKERVAITGLTKTSQ
jgi:hypothetical protein